MERRAFLKTAAAAGTAGVWAASCATDPTRTQASIDKPNFLFILTDDQGWGDLGCYGHPVLKTPHLDRLAEKGCRFTDFYVSMPICSPTRSSCLTGRDPNRYGFKHVINTGMVNPQVRVPEVHHLPVNEPSLPRQLKQAGYRTGTVGKWHLSHNGPASEPTPGDYGFDYWYRLWKGDSLYRGPSQWQRNAEIIDIPADKWYPEMYVDEAIRFIESGREPFYLNFWTFTPHVREEAAESMRALYEGRTEYEKTYFGSITQMDEQIGRLLDYLESKGLTQNTVIIFCSDNGPEPPVNEHGHEEARRGSTGRFRGAKHVIYEGGIRVPGIIYWPGLTKPGSISQTPVSVLDFFPTLCAATGASVPEGWAFDGADFRPALSGGEVQRPHPLYWQCEYSMKTFVPGFTSPPLAIREGHWKLMCDMQFGNTCLYNLDVDPTEQWNVDKCEPEIASSMLDKLKAIYADINGSYQREAAYLNPDILKGRKPQ